MVVSPVSTIVGEYIAGCIIRHRLTISHRRDNAQRQVNNYSRCRHRRFASLHNARVAYYMLHPDYPNGAGVPHPNPPVVAPPPTYETPDTPDQGAVAEPGMYQYVIC